MFLIIKSLSLSFCTLTAKCWCAFDGQCVNWINIQWVFDIRSRQWKASERENMLFFVFVVSFSSMSVCDWPTQSSYPKPWTQFTSHGAAQMRMHRVPREWFKSSALETFSRYCDVIFQTVFASPHEVEHCGC